MSMPQAAIILRHKRDMDAVKREMQASTVSELMKRYDVTESCVMGWQTRYRVMCRKDKRELQFLPPWNADDFFTANGSMGGPEVRCRWVQGSA